MRQWQLHHGLPSFNLDGSFPVHGENAPGQNPAPGQTPASGRNPAPENKSDSVKQRRANLAKQSAASHLSIFDPDQRGNQVATKLASPPKLTKTATSARNGQLDPAALVGDDCASQTTVGDLIPSAEMFRCDDIALAPLSDLAKCKQGDIVIYRIGVDDPVDAIANALARGASAILTEQILPCPLPQAIVGDVEIAAATIRRHQLGKPDQRQLTIAVTGSAGKTTTALWIAKLTREMGLATAYETSLGVSDSTEQSVPTEWVDGGLELIERLNQSAENSAAVSVIEINDSAATAGRYDSIGFDMVVCVGSNAPTTDFGPSPLIALMDCLVSDGVVIAPKANVEIMSAIEQRGVEVVTYGTEDADLTYEVLEDRDGLMTMLLSAGDTMHVVETTMTGSHNAANLTAAACVGRLFDRPIHSIGESLGSLRSVPGRVERITSVDHAPIILDAAKSPNSVAQILRELRSTTGGKVWAILAIDADDQSLPLMGNKLERHSHQNILTSAGDKSTFLKAAHEVIDGVQHCIECRLICDPAEAIRYALEQSNSGDVVVVFSGSRGNSPAKLRTQAQRWKRLACKASEQIDAGNEPRVELKVIRAEG